MRRSIPFALAAVMVVSMLACGGSDDGAQPSSSPTARLSSTAKVSIIEPTEGTVIQGTSVRVRIKLDGGKIVSQVSSNLKPDEGHIHLLLDGRVVQLLGSLDERIDNVVPGAHLLQVEFVAADHGPFSPRVISAVSFEAV
jgi:tRNA(Ile2) C34 agmatinyltransferase TiaS